MTTIQLPTSVLNHITIAADTPVPDALNDARPVHIAGRKTLDSTVTVHGSDLDWAEGELTFLLWRFQRQSHTATRLGLAKAQVQRALDIVRAARIPA